MPNFEICSQGKNSNVGKIVKNTEKPLQSLLGPFLDICNSVMKLPAEMKIIETVLLSAKFKCQKNQVCYMKGGVIKGGLKSKLSKS